MAQTLAMPPEAAGTAEKKAPLRWSHPALAALVYAAIVIVAQLIIHRNLADYVGPDNDDAMRLVEVRDFLAGQGWFDMMQYRLGLAGGTLMHWSRFIDLPIASLILFFRMFLSPEGAEAAALTVWPLMLVLPLMFFMGLAGRRIAGVEGMHFSLILTALFVLLSPRFVPGSIDHDNVQLGLVALTVAMLVDENYRPRNFAIAAIALAVQLGIGAETTPFVAIACMSVACLWAWKGEIFAPAAKAFALTLTIAVSAAFFSLVPPRLYSMITCDNLSLGFYGITSAGCVGLLLSSIFASRLSRPWRIAILAVNGAFVFAITVALAPQCLRNPLSDLDPMLVDFWLSRVTEAQSIISVAHRQPDTLGVFYATGLLAILVCAFRILRGTRPSLHAMLMALIAINWVITLVQVRGTEFANLLAIPPLALMIAELRKNYMADPKSLRASLLYAGTLLASVPAVWAVGGALASKGVANGFMVAAPVKADETANCTSQQALRPIAGLEPGVVAAASNLGAPLLRFTPHRTLSGPYHRDPDGMMAELLIGLAEPQQAESLLHEAKVTIVAFCQGDPQVELVSERAPKGLYAQLSAGHIPAYLEPIAAPAESDVQFFRVTPQD
ncbi:MULTISPECIES: hypothetical protein [Rhizobium]|uniref:GtrA family protein n=1 Tax=Rhizobium tropici TaxID=398 RepID=A0A6P1CAR6_RHITR|nr:MULTISPECIES: hypothetical protein [Rhizobium]MBB4239846.1 hypothetical protein [Rhizobium tropici]MBB5591116.1 hypothetical protein [Rhizobium tropici]MBB6489675.1 hypothetical protein [Rhizobium tropici]NEV12004.1 hypothetical protein [Rhizobium tropici]TGF00482.1 hypothetical protein C9417_06380 [Rhizobium sp. SEMIA 4088]